MFDVSRSVWTTVNFSLLSKTCLNAFPLRVEMPFGAPATLTSLPCDWPSLYSRCIVGNKHGG